MIESLLKEHGLRKTSFRIELLTLFAASKSSLSVDDIRTQVGQTNDKVTVYRALDAFEKSGLIHKVPDKGNMTRYALCQSACSHEGHTHNHAHFICNSCAVTFCLEDIEMPSIKKHKGFKVSKANLVLEGECPSCGEG